MYVCVILLLTHSLSVYIYFHTSVCRLFTSHCPYTHTHRLSSVGDVSATFSVGLMWQKNGAKDLAPESDRTSARPATRREQGGPAGFLSDEHQG